MRPRHRYTLSFALSSLACLQWILQRAAAAHHSPPMESLLSGLAILGAAFLLAWAAEAAEMDVPQSVAIGFLALITVLPEYAVDMVFAWKGGKDPTYIPYATANMTGANRLLIGLGWPAVLFAAWWKRGQRSITLSHENSVELFSLLAATLYAFLIPLKGSLSLLDAAVFIGIFAFYCRLASRQAGGEPELEGPAEMLAGLPTRLRRAAVIGLFLFSAGTILASAEPFAEGLVATGRQWGIEEFLLVQWLAPLASESPEFIVAILFALKGKAAVGMRALLSSKVNQWTLLIGMLPLVFGLSAGSPAAMPLDARQVEEVFLTCAQSLFGLVVLMNLNFALREALGLAALFSTQLLFPQPSIRYAYAFVYIGLSVWMVSRSRARLGELRYLLTESWRGSPKPVHG